MEGAEKYYSVVTDIGNARMTEALANGTKVIITEIAVGDGSGEFYQPEPSATALKNEVWRGPINSCRVSSQADNIMIINGIIPGEVGGFTVREMAVFTSEGEMLAISNTPATPKVTIVDGIINELSLALEIVLLNKNVINLLIDPTVVTATKQDINEIWDYLHSNGRVFIGTDESKLQENDICFVVDEIPWPQTAAVYTYLDTGEKASVITGDGKQVIIK